MYSCATFHINEKQLTGLLCVCILFNTGWGVLSCVCGMAFQCGRTLVKVLLLQAAHKYIPIQFDSYLCNKTLTGIRSWSTDLDIGYTWRFVGPCSIHGRTGHTWLPRNLDGRDSDRYWRYTCLGLAVLQTCYSNSLKHRKQYFQCCHW